MRYLVASFAVAALSPLLWASVAPAPQAESGAEARQAYADALAHPTDPAALERFKALLPRAGGYYVVEGDRLLTDAQVAVYVADRSAAPAPPRAGELLVNLVNGRLDRWCRAASDLTYAVDRASFGGRSQYETVVENLASAAREWEQACPACAITFSHRNEQDEAPEPEQVVFVVKGIDVQGAFLATAFFPSDPPMARVLQVDASYFASDYDPVGVLRHELGHVLGYRHEHIRDVAGCYFEDGAWKALGPYDPRSVMHYPCGGGGGRTFELSPQDTANHAAWYGEPEGGKPCVSGAATRVSPR